MNTFLSAAQEAQRERYRNFAAEVVAPVADRLIAHEVNLKEFLQQIAPQGYLGINVPKEYGGQGGTLLDVALFIEECAHYDPGLGLTVGDHAAVIELIKRYASEQAQSRYLPLLARGETIGTIAFSEAGAGTDYEAVQATIKDGLLNAQKRWVVSGDIAGLLVVLAKDGQQLVVTLVDRSSGGAIKTLCTRPLMGLRSAHVNDVEFKSVPLPDHLRLQSAEAAKKAALFAMSVSKVVLSAAALGLLERATTLALDHARKREQFGSNIGNFQGVQWKLADLGVDNLGCRLQVYRAAWSIDADTDNFIRYAAMCKLVSARAARFQSGEALQILGAEGIVDDGILARFYDDGKVMEIAQGTAEFQKIVLTKELNI